MTKPTRTPTYCHHNNWHGLATDTLGQSTSVSRAERLGAARLSPVTTASCEARKHHLAVGSRGSKATRHEKCECALEHSLARRFQPECLVGANPRPAYPTMRRHTPQRSSNIGGEATRNSMARGILGPGPRTSSSAASACASSALDYSLPGRKQAGKALQSSLHQHWEHKVGDHDHEDAGDHHVISKELGAFRRCGGGAPEIGVHNKPHAQGRARLQSSGSDSTSEILV